MRRYLFLILALATCFSARCGAKIEWDHTDHDFGAFHESMGAVTATFTLRNVGDEPLVITGARANCGCTTPQLSATEIAPGDSATLSVTYDPEGRPGRFEKRVYVDSNAEPKRSTLYIRGVCIGAPASVSGRFPVEVGPLRLAHPAALLGKVTKGHIKSVYEGGYNASTDTLVPVITDTPKWLDVRPLQPKVAPGEIASFNFYVNSAKIADWDMVTDTVTIRPYAGSPVAYRMPVVITVDDDFGSLSDKELAASPVASVSPEHLDAVNVDAPTVRTWFEVTNTGKSPLKIRRVYTLTPGISFDVKRDETVKPGKTVRVGVVLHKSLLPANRLVSAAVITVVTNDPLNPRTTVTLPIINKSN